MLLKDQDREEQGKGGTGSGEGTDYCHRPNLQRAVKREVPQRGAESRKEADERADAKGGERERRMPCPEDDGCEAEQRKQAGCLRNDGGFEGSHPTRCQR